MVLWHKLCYPAVCILVAHLARLSAGMQGMREALALSTHSVFWKGLSQNGVQSYRCCRDIM
jgi:hypothetical protein